MKDYVIFTDSACDIPTRIRKQYGIEYFPMGLSVDGEQKKADMDWEDYSNEEFNNWLSSGRKVKTSLITVETFYNMITKVFKEGKDVIYLGCSSALTGSINSFNLANEMLKDEYKDNRAVAVPTFTASATLGMMVVDAAREKAKGLSLDELCDWVIKNRFFYNQFCTVDTLTFLKDAGRIKGTKAFFGNLMGVKPIFISDRVGNNLVIEKVRGTKASLDAIFNHIKESYIPGVSDAIVILHSCCLDRANLLKERFINELGVSNITIDYLGPIVGTTCGPGTVAAFCYGKEVTRFDGDGIDVK